MYRGFSLVELLVVVALIALVATIITIGLNQVSVKGRDARRVEDLKELHNALQLYFDANSNYPTTLSGLAPTYLPVVPRDPIGQVAYPYDQTSGGASFHLGANLEQEDSQMLNSDADINTITVRGADTASCDGSTSTERHCYDIKP